MFSFPKDISDLLFVDVITLVVELKFIFGATHSKNPEAVDFGDELRGSLGHEVGVRLEKDVGEGGSKISAVDVKLLLARNVNVLAARAINLHPRGAKLFTNTDRQYVLAFAEHARTISERAQHVLFLHHR